MRLFYYLLFPVTPKEDNKNGILVGLSKDSAKPKHHQSNGHLQYGYLANIKLRKPAVDVDKELLNMHKYKITASCPEDIWKNEMQIKKPVLSIQQGDEVKNQVIN